MIYENLGKTVVDRTEYFEKVKNIEAIQLILIQMH